MFWTWTKRAISNPILTVWRSVWSYLYNIILQLFVRYFCSLWPLLSFVSSVEALLRGWACYLIVLCVWSQKIIPQIGWTCFWVGAHFIYWGSYPIYFLLFTTKWYFAYHKMGTSISKVVQHFLRISTGMMLVLNSPMKSWKMKIPFSQGRRFHVIAASLWSVETCLCKGIETGLTIAPVLETLWLTGLEVDTLFTFQILSYRSINQMHFSWNKHKETVWKQWVA